MVIPGSTLSLLSGNPANEIVDLAIGPLVLAFVLHVTSSIRLGSGGSGIFTLLLLFGGWLLMAVSLFAGCLVMFGPS